MNDAAPDLLVRLLTDQSERWARGQPVFVESYLQSYPQLAADAEQVLDLISNEIYIRFARGDSPSLGEYQLRFPQLSGQIDVQFQLHRAAGPLNGSVQPSAAVSRGSADMVPESFPDYEVIEEIGRGGMGVVFKAKQLSLRRVVALKVVRINGRDDADVHARFRSEALAVARLQHPNIVQIFEVGEHEDYSYFSLELVAGGNLAQRIRGKQLSEQEAARCVLSLARAMHYAHQRGVIHRDLKPANILVAPDGTHKITDFGLARLVRTNRRLTRTGDILGTPSYMAPEQAFGKAEVGAPADVYSLGAILYELLTGQPPFRAGDAIATLLLVGTAAPRSPTEFRPDLTPELNSICLKCLNKEQDQRYPTAEALADDLERYLAGHDVQAHPLGPLGRSARWMRRVQQRAAVFAAIILVAGMLAAGGALYVQHLERHRDDALRDRDAAQVERDAAVQKADAAEIQRLQFQESARVARTARDAMSKSVSTMETKLKEAGDKARLLDTANAKARQTSEEAQRQQEELRQALERSRRTNFARHLADAAERWALEPAQVGKALRDDTRCPPDLRDFTWGLLAHGRNCLLMPLHGQTGNATAVAAAPDGHIVAGGGDQGARLWDVEKNGESRTLSGIKGRVNSIAFSQNGKMVAIAASDAAHLFESSGKSLHKLSGQKAGPVNALAFRQNGKLWCASADGDVRIWNTGNGKEETVFRAHSVPIHALAIAPVTDWIATGGDDLVVRIAAEKAPAQTVNLLRGHTGRIHALAFSANGLLLASGSADETVRLWSMGFGEVKHILTGHGGIVQSIAFSRDGQTLAAGVKLLDAGKSEPNGAVRLWDVAGGKPLRTILMRHPVQSLAFLADGRLAVADGHDVELIRDALPLHARPVLTAAVSPDSKTIASGDQEGVIRLSDAATGATRHTLKGHAGSVNGVAFRPNDDALISGGADGSLRLWETSVGAARKTVDAHRGGVDCLAFAPRGDVLASGGQDRLVKLWGPGLQGPKLTLQGHAGAVACVAFSFDGLTLASGSVDGSIRLWKAANGELIRTLRESGPGVYSMVFLADGRELAIGGVDGVVSLLDTATGKVRQTLAGHRGLVWGLALSPDGKTLAAGAGPKAGTASASGEVRLWGPVAGQLRAVLTGQAQAVTSVAFAPDGSILVAASLDRSVKVWDSRRK